MQRPGSSIVMTPTGYMTEGAWLEMAAGTAAGIRAMPVICDNPGWWVVKIIDGFGPHTSSVEAMGIYAKHRIPLVKEEGDTSHVCQAYDQKVAKDDKATMRGCLAFLRQTTDLLRGNVDGWDLIHVGLAAVRELEPSSWVSSFKRVNLNPKERVEFPAWCERIGNFLEGGKSFKTEDELDVYQLLPIFWQVNIHFFLFYFLLNNCFQHAHPQTRHPFRFFRCNCWQGMSPEEKKSCVRVFEEHEKEWTPACIETLHAAVGVQLKDMQHLRVCLDAAEADPSHLDMMAPSSFVPTTLTAEGEQAGVLLRFAFLARTDLAPGEAKTS